MKKLLLLLPLLACHQAPQYYDARCWLTDGGPGYIGYQTADGALTCLDGPGGGTPAVLRVQVVVPRGVDAGQAKK